MTRILRPLFAAEAYGRIADLGAFRRGRHGPEFIGLARPVDRATPDQRRVRACLAAARRAYIHQPKSYVLYQGVWQWRKWPLWPVFLSDWFADHPECQ